MITVAATRITWVRHGPTGINDRWIGRADVPAVLPEPAKLGLFWDALQGVDRVICSPLIRARQTAAALLPDHRAERVDGLMEQDFGAWENRPYDQFQMPAELDADGLAAFKAPEGESFVDVCQRVGETIAGISSTHAGEHIAIVAHAGVIRAALVHALNAPAASGIAFRIDHLSLTAITLFEGGGAAIGCVNRGLI